MDADEVRDRGGLMRHWVLMLLAVSMSFIVFGPPATAQETTDDDLLEQMPEISFEGEVTVTGSLIPRADLTALSPVTVMDVPTELTYSGTVRIEDLITTMPQVFAGQNSTLTGGSATGTASIDLRYLGPFRTLVLINGRRMAFGDYNGADINAIPAPLVKRVDVLTGGASAVYGSDALAGVVNFILDTDFTGVRGGLQYSFYNHDNSNEVAQQLNAEQGYPYPTGWTNDGEALNGNIALGGAFADGRGHATAYIDYRKIESLTKSQRDYLNCSVWADDGGPYCGGSAATGRGTFLSWHADGTTVNGVYTLDLQEEGGDGHSLRPRTGERFNYGPYNHIQRPDEKWNAGAFANYEINEHFDVYMEIMYMNDYTDAQIAPSGSFGRIIDRVHCSNPMLSEQQRDIFCTQAGYGDDDYAHVNVYRRNVEGGPRINQLGHTNSRLLAGLRGDITNAWSYDIYGLRAESLLQQSNLNDVNIESMSFALDVIEDPTTGEWVCRNEQARANGCVPWNIYQEGAVTPEATDYISTVAVLYGRTQTEVLNLTFTGDLESYGVVIPSASEGLQLAAGAEYRNEQMTRVPDEVFQTSLVSHESYAIDESFNVSELFLEALVPIVQDVKGAQDFSLELGYRWSDYSASGVFNTYKAMAGWAISPSWRLRGGYNRAVRAPSIVELYEPVLLVSVGYTDLCQGQNPAATFEQCAHTGVTAEQYGNIPALPPGWSGSWANSGGNPHLNPETGDTVTAGVVWTPEGIHGLSVTLDYYRIEIDDAVDDLTAETVHRVCMDTGNPDYCDLIHRDDLGSLWVTWDGYTDLTNQNVGLATSEGIDVNANYLIGLGAAGYLATDLMGTYMLTQNLSSPEFDYECVGYFGSRCGTPQSLWRHRFRATWESNIRLNLSMAWRMIGPADVDYASPSPDLSDPEGVAFYYANGSHRVRAYHWFDFAASYTFRSGVKLTLGVNNIFDEEPPLLPNYADSSFINLYANYDPLGRYVFSSVQFNF